MRGRTYSYTSADEGKVRRVEGKLRAAGIKFETARTEPGTFVVEGEAVTVGSARPFNIKVAAKHRDALNRIIGEDKSGE